MFFVSFEFTIFGFAWTFYRFLNLTFLLIRHNDDNKSDHDTKKVTDFAKTSHKKHV